MPYLDDHYQQVAAANPAPRSMRDVTPNGDDIRSRTFGAHVRNNRDRDSLGFVGTVAGNMTQFGVTLALKVACEECDAEPGANCRSIAKDHPGVEMKTSAHGKRVRAGMAAHRRKDS